MKISKWISQIIEMQKMGSIKKSPVFNAINIPPLSEKNILISAFLILFVGTMMLFGEDTPTPPPEVLVEVVVDPFLEISLEAQAVFVWDVSREEVIYAKNEEMQLPLASLTKVMTALIVIESLGGDAIVSISSDDIREEGDSGLLVGEEWLVKDLIDLTLITSSNDGAAALASAVSSLRNFTDFAYDNDIEKESLFSEKVNNKIKEVGMNQTFFINASGLDISRGVSGAYGSARDVALLFSYIVKHHPSLLEATTHKAQQIISSSGFIHPTYNTNKRVESLPGIMGSKTGFTDLAGGNLAVIFEAGLVHPIAIVVLGSSREGRFDDVEKLVWASLKSLQMESGE